MCRMTYDEQTRIRPRRLEQRQLGCAAGKYNLAKDAKLHVPD